MVQSYRHIDIVDSEFEKLYNQTCAPDMETLFPITGGNVPSVSVCLCSFSYSSFAKSNRNQWMKGIYPTDHISNYLFVDHVETEGIVSLYDKTIITIEKWNGLADNWDGMGAKRPDSDVIANSIELIKTLQRENLVSPFINGVDLTPYGTIVIDLSVTKGDISIEVGKTMLGFFTDFADGHNYGSEGIKTDFKSIPGRLMSLLY